MFREHQIYFYFWCVSKCYLLWLPYLFGSWVEIQYKDAVLPVYETMVDIRRSNYTGKTTFFIESWPRYVLS